MTQSSKARKPAFHHSGTLLTLIGVVHCLFGVYMGASVLGRMLSDGVWNSVLVGGSLGPALDAHFNDTLTQITHTDALQRFGIFWFISAGVFWIGGGLLCNHVTRTTDKPLPRPFAWFVLLYGALSCVMLPVSGFWSVLALGVVLVRWSRAGEDEVR